MKNPLKIIDKKLREKYWYNDWEYQYVRNALIGWSISIVAIIIRFIKYGFY